MTTHQQPKGNTMAADTPLNDFIEHMNSDVKKLLEIEELEDTLENRAEIIQDFLNEFNENESDSFINRSIRLMFEFFIENLTRESQGLEPIPFQ